MAITNKALRQYQWARETVKGTDLPATSKIAVVGIDFEDDSEYERPKFARGLMVRNPGNEFVARRGTRWSVQESPLVYEQMQNWCSMLIEGGQAGIGTGPTVWTFQRSHTADPALDAFTFERRLNTGANQVDHAWHYAQATKMSIKGSQGSSIKFTAEGFARRRQLEASTVGPLPFPTKEHAAFAQSLLWLDGSGAAGTWASLGTTAILGQMYGFNLDIMSGVTPEETADGRADLDYSTTFINADEYGFDLELLMLLDHTKFAQEVLLAESQTLRAVRIRLSNGGAGATLKQIDFDLLGKYTESPVKVDEKDGQDVVSLKLTDATDGTEVLRVAISNQVTTLI